jgi:hypothetical protein
MKIDLDGFGGDDQRKLSHVEIVFLRPADQDDKREYEKKRDSHDEEIPVKLGADLLLILSPG